MAARFDLKIYPNFDCVGVDFKAIQCKRKSRTFFRKLWGTSKPNLPYLGYLPGVPNIHKRIRYYVLGVEKVR